MEVFYGSIHTPLASHTYAKNFRSRVKSRPSVIVSVFRINKEFHKTGKEKTDRSLIGLREQSPVSSVLNLLDKMITKFLDPPLHLSVDPTHVLSGNFAPVDELGPTECEIEQGRIPSGLDGVYIRNGPNPQFLPSGPYHYFDGDGMVHCVRISRGRATFCSRYVKTNKFMFERNIRFYVVPNVIGGMRGLASFIARAALFATRVVLENYDIGKGIGVANTNLAFFGGRLYALCESDIPYAIELTDNGDVVTLGPHDFDGKLSLNMTAHPKTDPKTNETFAFRYWATRPYLTYFRFDPNGNKQPDVPIFSMEHPSLTHDLAITGKYAIVCETQIGANPVNLVRGGRFVGVDLTKVPRIGVLPRYAIDESNMKWFEVPGFNIFHAVNAWDETDEHGGDVVVMVAPNIKSVEHFFDRVDLIHGSMEKVRIHLETGVVSRHTMSLKNLEFPVINPAYIAKKNKYIYASMSEQTSQPSMITRVSGVAKLDISTSDDSNGRHECIVASRTYGHNCFGGEPFFVSRDPDDKNAEEDDGYVMSYVHDESSGESRLLVMDARSPSLKVVAVVKLPQRVPYGLHGIFIREKNINGI